MSLVEPLEARCLFAVTPDVTFANGGHRSFSVDYSVENVLATHGEIYVQAYQRRRERTVIFKYTDDGVLDANWGGGGYVLPQRFADLPASQSLDIVAMVRDSRTGGLLVGTVDYPATRVGVQRFTADGTPDLAWNNGQPVTYTEPKTNFTLPRVIALPHKRVMLAIGREQQLSKDTSYSKRGGADDVALLKLDPLGHYDRAFNTGHALTVAMGNFQATNSDVDDATTQRTEEYTVPTFGDIQFFADGTIRVVSTREETHQTTTTHNVDVITTVGQSTFSAESAKVTADGTVKRSRTPSYVLKRTAMTDDGSGDDLFYKPRAAVASADGTGIAVLAETSSSTGGAGGSILRVGPNYRSRAESLPAPFATRYLGDVRRTGSGVVVVGSAGTGSADPDNDKLLFGPGLLSLGRDLAVGRNQVILPLTYFPAFALDIYTLDDTGRLLVEGTNLKTNTFDLTRYV